MPRRLLPLLLFLAALAGAGDVRGETLLDGGTGVEEPPAEENTRRFESVVTGSRTERLAEDSVVPTEVLTRRDIERSGARDLVELLETHAGVEFERTTRGTSIRLQGLDSAGVIILIDGQRVPGRIGGLLDLARFTLRDIERVELIKGPASALYGSDAMAGIIHLITRRDSAPREATAQVSYGMRNELDLRATGALQGERLAARVGGGRRSATGYDLDPSNATTNGVGTSGFDVNGAIEWTPRDELELQLSADYLWKDNDGVDELGTGAIFDRRERTELFGAMARARWKIDARSTGSFSLRHSQFRDQLLQDQRASRQLDQYEDARERLTEAFLQYDRTLFDSHAVTVGAEQGFQDFEAPRLEGGSGNRRRTAIFAQDEWTILERVRLVLAPGARVDLDSQFGLHVSPRVALGARPLENLTLRAAWGHGFRAPSFEELLLRFSNAAVGYVVEGNPALSPERSEGLTLSVDHAPRDWLQLSAAVFQTDLRDLITIGTLAEATPDSPTRFGYLNIARARSRGGELAARVRLFQTLWLDLGYGLTDARDVDTGELLEGRSIHRATARLSGRLRPLGLEGAVSLAWNGPRRFANNVDGSDVWTAPWTRLDLNLKRRVWRHLSLFAGARNLFDAGDASYLPIAPRQFYGGVEMNL